MANDFAWPQHTPEGFGVDGWDGLLHLHAFEKVMGVEWRPRCCFCSCRHRLRHDAHLQMWIKLPWDADGTVSQWAPVVGVSRYCPAFASCPAIIAYTMRSRCLPAVIC
jgi:hypothetical protein